MPRWSRARARAPAAGAGWVAARPPPPAPRPEKLLLAFARGVGADIVFGLADEFRAVEVDLLAEFVGEAEDDKEEDGWVSVSFHPNEEIRRFRAFEIEVVDGGGEVLLPPPLREVEEGSGDQLEGCLFADFLGKMRMNSMEMVNLDTTALIAIVSGISNGGVGKLMGAPEAETRARFKCNYKFVMDQVQSELQSPIFVELGKAVDGKKCIICEAVNSEFNEIVSMCASSFMTNSFLAFGLLHLLSDAGKSVNFITSLHVKGTYFGVNKLASYTVFLVDDDALFCPTFLYFCVTIFIYRILSKCFWTCRIVPDSPSARMMDLPTTRKLAMKNKVVFGTGDRWRAPTLTANMGFVRAVSQSGMPLLTIEHRPRALIGL
ncbi:hypothetical protein TRIUR3_10210 [Triticum urartu]|uniref:DUF1308 domain-containing protein n=1 Tax=Triticum urartu TaxID=4572 RepID=M8AAL9_TRIUA|nr:hypothetical protein TRIUR3_10210 [Triticum urartu]